MCFLKSTQRWWISWFCSFCFFVWNQWSPIIQIKSDLTILFRLQTSSTPDSQSRHVFRSNERFWILFYLSAGRISNRFSIGDGEKLRRMNLAYKCGKTYLFSLPLAPPHSASKQAENMWMKWISDVRRRGWGCCRRSAWVPGAPKCAHNGTYKKKPIIFYQSVMFYILKLFSTGMRQVSVASSSSSSQVHSDF